MIFKGLTVIFGTTPPLLLYPGLDGRSGNFYRTLVIFIIVMSLGRVAQMREPCMFKTRNKIFIDWLKDGPDRFASILSSSGWKCLYSPHRLL